MKIYRFSGLGCFVFGLLALFILTFVLRLLGLVVFSVFSSPLVFLLVLLGLYLLLKRSPEKPDDGKVEIEYEFIDEEDPED